MKFEIQDRDSLKYTHISMDRISCIRTPTQKSLSSSALLPKEDYGMIKSKFFISKNERKTKQINDVDTDFTQRTPPIFLYFNNENQNENDKFIRILLVEDEKLIRTAQINSINKFSKNKNITCEIVVCEDGIECLNQIYKGIQQEIKYDIILTDETINFMRGSLLIEIITQLIKENIVYSLQIFMITNYESSSIKQKHGNLVDQVFTKPLTTDNIRTIFNSLT